jgi:hypothetical protein
MVDLVDWHVATETAQGPASKQPLTLAAFLREEQRCARRHPEALPDLVGDAILLEHAPFHRRLRNRALALGVRYAAVARWSREPIEPLRARIEYVPNRALWTDLGRRGPTVTPRSVAAQLRSVTVVRDTARWIAGRVLAALPLAPDERIVLGEAFAHTGATMAGFFDAYDEAPKAAYLAHARASNWPLVPYFRLLELHLGTARATACLIAQIASSFGVEPYGPDDTAELADVVGVPEPLRRLVEPIFHGMVRTALLPTTMDRDAFRMRQLRAQAGRPALIVRRKILRDARVRAAITHLGELA